MCRLQIAGLEVLISLQNIYNNSPNKTDIPTSLSVQWYQAGEPLCRTVWDNQTSLPCLEFDIYSAPALNLSLVDFGTSVEFQESVAAGPTQYYSTPVINMFQAVHAAVRLDLGNALPNNMFTNTTYVLAANQTILPERTLLQPAVGGQGSVAYQAASILYSDLTRDVFLLPVNGSQRSTLAVPFMCSSSTRKEWGSIIVSVFVATVTMLGTGWSSIRLVATYFAKRELESE